MLLLQRLIIASQQMMLFAASRREIYQKLSSLYPTHACKQYLDAFHQLEKYCGYQADHIPQLQEVCTFLKGKIYVAL